MTSSGKWTSAAVGFVDLLGSKEYATGLASRAIASEIEEALTSARRLVSDVDDIARTFTDNTVIVVPVSADLGSAGAVIRCVKTAAQLALGLGCKGFFLRGGISLGEVYVADHMVFGPALVEAYEVEAHRAVFPRIMLAPPAVAAILGALPEAVAIAPDGETFVDYLDAANTTSTLARILCSAHRDRISERLSEHIATGPVWQKYWWLAEYHNWKVSALALGDLAIPAAAERGLQFVRGVTGRVADAGGT